MVLGFWYFCQASLHMQSSFPLTENSCLVAVLLLMHWQPLPTTFLRVAVKFPGSLGVNHTILFRCASDISSYCDGQRSASFPT